MSIYGAQAVDSPRHDDAAQTYDALLFLSFGGPEGMDDVMPFLRNVSRGRNIPDARLAEVAHHYEGFGGISPINAQNRALIAAMEAFKRGFSNSQPLLKLVRAVGMSGINNLPWLKSQIIAQALGNTGDLPKLARPTARYGAVV